MQKRAASVRRHGNSSTPQPGWDGRLAGAGAVRAIQEIIRAVFAAHPSAAFLTKDLCEIIHPSLPTRRHIAETNRQARGVVAADPHRTCELSADQRQVVFFNRVDERSVEAAQTLLAPKPKRPRMRRPARPRRAVAFPT